jgi:hypothetical protein
MIAMNAAAVNKILNLLFISTLKNKCLNYLFNFFDTKPGSNGLPLYFL